MDTRGRLVAGSHNRNEFILINADEASRVRGLPKPNPTHFSSCFLLVLGCTHFLILVFLNLGLLKMLLILGLRVVVV